MTIRMSELAWCAGFLDGEGSFCLSSSGRTIITVQQNCPEPLHKLVKVLNGTVTGPYERIQKIGKNVGHVRIYWVWRISSKKDVSRALRLLRPHLVVKGEDADRLAGALNIWASEAAGGV